MKSYAIKAEVLSVSGRKFCCWKTSEIEKLGWGRKSVCVCVAHARAWMRVCAMVRVGASVCVDVSACVRVCVCACVRVCVCACV